jgi:hypothetical protein
LKDLDLRDAAFPHRMVGNTIHVGALIDIDVRVPDGLAEPAAHTVRDCPRLALRLQPSDERFTGSKRR